MDCFSGQLNQVFMNILANAIDAVNDFNSRFKFAKIKLNTNKITIKNFIEKCQLKISVADHDKGMSEEIKHKIFDHLCTTKAVGNGKSLRIAIARQIVE
ncbi:two-component hybrid sensor and regulator [Anabaenopsis circularis NIES-21]|uniref:Two-component hybrid sensor and regulator n=1 Tax=Anabaenopsis circularis NIES-21 TaxID=1085406 RepID=A0A1Z4GG33_9CYAN|nr:two-component hybrid sensor and regulator [Anabaenopsis circularis NIES-21]